MRHYNQQIKFGAIFALFAFAGRAGARAPATYACALYCKMVLRQYRAINWYKDIWNEQMFFTIRIPRRKHSRGRQKSNRDDDLGNKETWGDVLPTHLSYIFLHTIKSFPTFCYFTIQHFSYQAKYKSKTKVFVHLMVPAHSCAVPWRNVTL